jgi:hypothetical protein
MCKRSTPDPLVRTFLDRYNLNLLPLPRSGIECCDLFRRADDGRVSTEFALGNVVTPDLGELKLDLGEHLGALEGTLSHGRDLDFGLGLLGGFLAALGAPGVLNRVGTQYRRSRTQSLAFEFREATRDSVDPGALGNALIDRRLRQDHPLVLEGSRYFVVSGLARSPSLTVHATTHAESGGGFDVEAVQVASAQAGLTVRRESDTAVTYKGNRALVFGVELYELFYDDGQAALRMLTPDGPLYSHGAQPLVLEPAFVGPDGDAFIELEPASPRPRTRT